MTEPLQQRVNERKIYEEIVNLIVDHVNHEFSDNEAARLRIYRLIAENFDGMVRALSRPSDPIVMSIIESREEPEDG